MNSTQIAIAATASLGCTLSCAVGYIVALISEEPEHRRGLWITAAIMAAASATLIAIAIAIVNEHITILPGGPFG